MSLGFLVRLCPRTPGEAAPLVLCQSNLLKGSAGDRQSFVGLLPPRLFRLYVIVSCEVGYGGLLCLGGAVCNRYSLQVFDLFGGLVEQEAQ